jgi:hypothetical protein
MRRTALAGPGPQFEPLGWARDRPRRHPRSERDGLAGPASAPAKLVRLDGR